MPGQSDMERLDEVARMLCYLCGELEADALLEKLQTPQIRQWWKKHKASDKRRVQENMDDACRGFGDGGIFTNEWLVQMILDDAENMHPVSRFHKAEFLKWADVITKRHNTKNATRHNAMMKLTVEEQEELGIPSCPDCAKKRVEETRDES